MGYCRIFKLKIIVNNIQRKKLNLNDNKTDNPISRNLEPEAYSNEDTVYKPDNLILL